MFLVLIYLCLTVKPIKRVCNFCTKICDSIRNYVHHVKKQRCKEVEDGYISVNLFIIKKSDCLNDNLYVQLIIRNAYFNNNYFATLLIKITEMIHHTEKP